MPDEPGFEIGGETYPFPQGFRLCDPVLVAEVTGMSWMEFAELLDDQDPRTLAGLIAVSVWQKNPRWKRDKVIHFVEGLELDAIGFAGDAGGADVTPPEGEAGNITKPSAEQLMPISVGMEHSDASTPASSGPQSSATSAV